MLKNRDEISNVLCELLLYVLITAFIALSIYIQFHTLMNTDAANALDESRVLLNGGTYFFNIFETTPPLFLYLDFPVVILIKYFQHIPFFVLFFAYYLLITLACLKLCYLASPILNAQNKWMQCTLIASIALVYFVVFPICVGQREYTALFLTVPYFLLLCRRVKKDNISQGLAIAVGITGGIGFAIKPHFCVPFFLSECYVLWCINKSVTFLRIENVIVYCLFLLYFGSTYFLYPEYFHAIVPLATTFYDIGVPNGFFALMNDKKILYVLLMLIFYVFFRKQSVYTKLLDAIAIATVGYTFSYFLGWVSWGYHSVPAFGFSIILGMLVCYEYFIQLQKNNEIKITHAILIGMIFSLTVYYYLHTSFLKKELFIVLIFLCLCAYLSAGVIIIFSRNKYARYANVVTMGVLLLSLPMGFAYQCYRSQNFFATINAPLIQFLHQYAEKKPVYFLTSVLEYEYPAVDYSGAIHVSRFPYLLWMPGVMYQLTHWQGHQKQVPLQGVYDFFLKLTAADIAAKKPEYILVENSPAIAMGTFAIPKLNYVELFSHLPAFQVVWKNYHYFKTVDAPNYTFAVYKRNNE